MNQRRNRQILCWFCLARLLAPVLSSAKAAARSLWGLIVVIVSDYYYYYYYYYHYYYLETR